MRDPSPVVPSANRTTQSPFIRRVPICAVVAAVADRRERSMKIVSCNLASSPMPGQPAISDFATNDSGRLRADHRDIEPGNMIGHDQARARTDVLAVCLPPHIRTASTRHMTRR
jgi:hypothetical protein